jgi:ribosomal protein S18 acetylase RimI-like enzyme
VAGEPAAVGLGVVNGPWLGIFCMSTRPAARRQGAATALLRTLAIWGGLYDAREAYLQVKQENAAALGVYARAGFVTEYPYFYRIKG